MATPYLQLRVEEVASTQDRARAELDDLPVVVTARRQTAGRGRGGTPWQTAPRALAVSIAIHPSDADTRPFSLMAGVAAARWLEEVTLKWPNDLMLGDHKVGGILVERAEEMVVGLGLNLWWPDPPPGIAAIHGEDPGSEAHATVAGLWAAEMMALIEADGWPADEYRSRCGTLGREITWEPEGRGRALDINEDGLLVVETDSVRKTLASGVVHHVRG